MEKQLAKKFVVATRDIKSFGKILVGKGDVGIIRSEPGESTVIFFISIWREISLSKKDFEIFEVKKAGDGFPKKICNICHKLLNTTEFDKNQNGINNRTVRRPSCKECRKQLDGTKMGAKERAEWYKTRPMNVPFECPICGKRTIAGVTSKVVLDHNHRTGGGRAWVCDSCNTGIGRFKDDKKLLERAIKFIESTE